MLVYLFFLFAAELEAVLVAYYPDIEVKASNAKVFEDPRKSYAKRFCKYLFTLIQNANEKDSNKEANKSKESNEKNNKEESNENASSINNNDNKEESKESNESNNDLNNNLNGNDANGVNEDENEDENESKEKTDTEQEFDGIQAEALSQMIVKRNESSDNNTEITDSDISGSNGNNGVNENKNDSTD